jgi:hypothetical protein
MAIGFVDKLLGRYRQKDTTLVVIQRTNTGFSNFFVNNDSPEVTGYWGRYGQLYGEVPNVQLAILNPDGTLTIKNDVAPEMIPQAGHVDIIRFDLGRIMTGFIILS